MSDTYYWSDMALNLELCFSLLVTLWKQ